MKTPLMPEVYHTTLGSISARRAGGTAPLRLSEQVRLLLARLLLRFGARVTTEAIAGALWGEEDRASRRDGVHHALAARSPTPKRPRSVPERHAARSTSRPSARRTRRTSSM